MGWGGGACKKLTQPPAPTDPPTYVRTRSPTHHLYLPSHIFASNGASGITTAVNYSSTTCNNMKGNPYKHLSVTPREMRGELNVGRKKKKSRHSLGRTRQSGLLGFGTCPGRTARRRTIYLVRHMRGNGDTTSTRTAACPFQTHD